MSDKQPNPAPDDGLAGADPLAALAGNSIDDLLAEAESLASQVAEEVGADDEQGKRPSPPVEPALESSPHVAQSGAPEATLAEMETLLTGGSGTEPPDSGGLHVPADHEQPADAAEPAVKLAHDTADALPDSPVPGPEAAVTAVPAPATDGPPESPQAPMPHPASPPAMSDDDTVIDDEIAAANMPPPTPGTDGLPADSSTSQETPAKGQLQRVNRRVAHGLKAAPRLIVSSPYWMVIGLLYLIDLPFAWMSHSLKQKLGYVGLVTAVMAIFAWAMVFLGYGG